MFYHRKIINPIKITVCATFFINISGRGCNWRRRALKGASEQPFSEINFL
jgi:hypothetical protein